MGKGTHLRWLSQKAYSDAEEVTDAEEESEVESVVADAEDAEEEPRITDTVQTYTLQMLRRGGKKPNHQTAVQNGSLFVLEIQEKERMSVTEVARAKGGRNSSTDMFQEQVAAAHKSDLTLAEARHRADIMGKPYFCYFVRGM